jgi:uncharacterized protein (TIGR00369 family)
MTGRDSQPESALARLVRELESPPFHAVLRPVPVSADGEAGVVHVRLPFRPEFRRAPVGAHFHGGVIASLIDLTAYAAVAVHVRQSVPTIDLRIDYLRGAPGVTLDAVGRVLRAGRTIAQAEVEVKANGRLVAVGRGVFSVLTSPDPANA